MEIVEENRLINKILDGDAQAFAVLVHRYQRPVFNLMLRMTRSQEDATDLTQEAFLRAYERLESFRPSGRFFPWLYAIGMNLAVDHLRKHKHAALDVALDRSGGESEAVPEDSVDIMLERLDAGRLPELMARLPPDYREALLLRFREGLAMKEVGTALGITTSGAKMRIQRGLRRLRQMLGVSLTDRLDRERN
ncbi:MAG: sigma-70 family RNA polymerase sigma factor [Desulfobacteraceae bacterium]|nr:sigma-70 family RNA polymerase sigma factor [Desulfobacteraceae bacterium]